MLVNLFALLNCVIIKSNLFIKFFAFRKLFIRHCSPWSEQTSYTTFIIILIKRNFISCKFQQTKMSNHLNYYGKFGNWFQNNYKSYNKEQEIQDSTKKLSHGKFPWLLQILENNFYVTIFTLLPPSLSLLTIICLSILSLSSFTWEIIPTRRLPSVRPFSAFIA